MRARTAIPLFAVAMLPACSLFDNTDPRELAEPVEQCVTRFGEMQATLADDDSEVPTRPIYTFDVTKLPFAELQDLIAKGGDDTAGQRLLRQTNEESTAVDLFMSEPPGEKGIFFLGRDPALYRVRGPEIWPRETVETGCAMQVAGMRLTEISVASGITVEPVIVPEPESEDTSTENENS